MHLPTQGSDDATAAAIRQETGEPHQSAGRRNPPHNPKTPGASFSLEVRSDHAKPPKRVIERGPVRGDDRDAPIGCGMTRAREPRPWRKMKEKAPTGWLPTQRKLPALSGGAPGARDGRRPPAARRDPVRQLMLASAPGQG